MLFEKGNKLAEEVKISMVPVEELKTNPDNPRVNSAAVPAVADSIRMFGFRVPVVIDQDKMILAGHTRYRAALRLGLEEIPCIDASDLSEEEQTAFSVAENRTSDYSFFDIPKLAEIVEDVPEDLLASFDIDSLLGSSDQPDEVDLEDKKQPTKRDGLDLAPFEKYQYVTIICRTEFDYVNLLEQLELEDVQRAYVDGSLKRGSSYGRVIEYADYRERLEKIIEERTSES